MVAVESVDGHIMETAHRMRVQLRLRLGRNGNVHWPDLHRFSVEFFGNLAIQIFGADSNCVDYRRLWNFISRRLVFRFSFFVDARFDSKTFGATNVAGGNCFAGRSCGRCFCMGNTKNFGTAN